MGLLPDTQNCGCACAGNAGNVSPSPQVSDPDMHHGTCVTHVPWCMPGSLNSGLLWNWRRGGNVPGIPGACATWNFTYLVRGPWHYRVNKCIKPNTTGSRIAWNWRIQGQHFHYMEHYKANDNTIMNTIGPTTALYTEHYMPNSDTRTLQGQ